MVILSSKVLIKAGLKIVTPALKLLKSKLEKDLFIYSKLRNNNCIKISCDFNSVYLETLYQLIYKKNKSKKIIAIFDIIDVREAFNSEIYNENNLSFQICLDSNLHTNPKLRYLKETHIDIDTEIEEFRMEFKKVINLTRKPKEVEQYEVMKKVSADVSEFIDTEKLNKKFKTNVEINSQVIFSESKIHPLSDHISRRKELVQSYLDLFQSKKWIAINGSVSMGKTQAAVLLSKRNVNSTYWINLKELDESNFLFKIFNDLSSFLSVNPISDMSLWQIKIISKIEKYSLIILDELPKLNYGNQTGNVFVSFIKACAAKNIYIFSTSNYGIPRHIKELLSEDIIHEKPIPILSVEEILEILLTYDISETKAKEFKNLLYTISSGHPTIVKVMCSYFVKNGWVLTNSEIEKISKEDDFFDINKDTYDILSRTIKDSSTRNLLYRLNIIIGNFTLKEVRVIGDCSPEIDNTIERFNETIGVWVQKVYTNNFELSPLVKRLKATNLNSQLEKNINLTLGRNILEKHTLNQFDASKAIRYFISARSFNEAGFVLTLVLKDALNNPKIYFEWGFNLYWHYSPLPKEMDLVLQLYIRTLQVTLNQQENKDVLFLISDLESICDKSEKKGINIGASYLLLSRHYFTKDSKKALKYLMTGNDQYNALMQNVNRDDFVSSLDFETMIWFSVTEVSNIVELDNWFETIKGLSSEQFNNFKYSESIDFGSIYIYKNIQEKEENKSEDNRDWNNVISIFKHLQKKSLELGLDLMHANAVRYIINIHSEKMNDVSSALEYAQDNINSLSSNQITHFIVWDAIGRQLFYNNRIQEARSFITKAVDIDVDSFYIEKIDTYLVMSQIVGKEDNELACSYLVKAKNFAFENKNTSDIFQAKVLGEYATSLFLINDIKGAIYVLEEGYQLLLDSYSITPEYHFMTMRYGHALNYWYHLLTNKKPPEKDILGGVYEIPRRGDFISNYKDDKVEEFYFDERKFIVSSLLYNSFEYLLDFKMAKKWALNNISIHNELSSNRFGIITALYIPYLIIDDKYTEALNLQIDSIADMNKESGFVQNNERLINNKYLENIIKDRPKDIIKEYDDPVTSYVIVPIILDYIAKYGHDIKGFNDNIGVIMELIDTSKSKFKDVGFLESLSNILLCTSAPKDIIMEINNIVKSYEGELGDNLKMIGYLISSVFSSSLEALKYHFALINRLDSSIRSISKGSYYCILIPFLEKFWFNRIDKHKDEFYYLDFWNERSIKYYNESDMDKKVKKLFKILVHHLNYKISSQEEDWLE